MLNTRQYFAMTNHFDNEKFEKSNFIKNLKLIKNFYLTYFSFKY